MAGIYEHEIKILGTRPQLEDLRDKFIQKALFKDDPKENIFPTNYYDYHGKFEAQGYSLRFRHKRNGHGSCFELKDLGSDIDVISSRLEIAGKGKFVKAYFNLLANPDYPQDAPTPDLYN